MSRNAATHRASDRSGGIRWGRFTVLCALGAVGMGVIGGGIASGQLPMNFAVSGQSFIGTFGAVDGDGITVYPRAVDTAAGSRPSIAVKVDSARLSDVCLSTVARGLPLIGDVTMFARVPGTGLTAETLVVDVASVNGSVDVNDVRLGVDASATGEVQGRATAPAMVGASHASATSSEIIALTATHASLTNLIVSAEAVDHSC
ncbi:MULTISPECIES: DUF6230 family protein [unclassified Rhodococcus (in: high G+C Gram-positive bacteria)]|uniref:DUF6230 family protein n=1 Tax=unclassified Rhodococcus (in: high G+C Gram-positive bacteria) TaxID=192944 RepID=UPI000B26304A|nr:MULTISPECIES: DUF6230 family protein [unclassified Rhodococcus (in: high G+C Gram-positive bacteria)]